VHETGCASPEIAGLREAEVLAGADDFKKKPLPSMARKLSVDPLSTTTFSPHRYHKH